MLVLADLTSWATVGLGVATLVLAVATGLMVFFTRKAVNQGQEQTRISQEQIRLNQKQIDINQEQIRLTQEEIQLNRGEVVQAHRPVLVPRAYQTTYATYQQPGASAPTSEGIRIMVQNIGSGPALKVTATIQFCEPDGSLTEGWGSSPFSGTYPAVGVRLQRIVPIEVRSLGDLRVFRVELSYEDVAAALWTTTAVFLTERAANGDARYIDVTFSDPPALAPATQV